MSGKWYRSPHTTPRLCLAVRERSALNDLFRKIVSEVDAAVADAVADGLSVHRRSRRPGPCSRGRPRSPGGVRCKQVICGAGLDGLVLASQLGRGGWDVLVVRDSPHETAAPLLVELRGEALLALEQMGILSAVREAAEPVSRMRWFDVRGHEIASADVDDCSPAGCLRVQRERVETILLQQLPVCVSVITDIAVTAVTPYPECVSITLSDGERVQTDLLLAADGGHSRIRELVFGGGRSLETTAGLSLGRIRFRGRRGSTHAG